MKPKAVQYKASERGVSLNSLALSALEDLAGVNAPKNVHHDLDQFLGTWVHDPEFDKAVAEFRVVDPRDWE